MSKHVSVETKQSQEFIDKVAMMAYEAYRIHYYPTEGTYVPVWSQASEKARANAREQVRFVLTGQRTPGDERWFYPSWLNENLFLVDMIRKTAEVFAEADRRAESVVNGYESGQAILGVHNVEPSTCRLAPMAAAQGVSVEDLRWTWEIAAVVTHEANRAYCIRLGDHSQDHWEDAPEWQRASARQGVLGAFRGATPQESHENWMQQKRADGWVYGPVKDVERKQHPCMVPYSELPPEQKKKDLLLVTVARAVAEAFEVPRLPTVIAPYPPGSMASGSMHEERLMAKQEASPQPPPQCDPETDKKCPDVITGA